VHLYFLFYRFIFTYNITSAQHEWYSQAWGT
jgi:hypothetical protein